MYETITTDVLKQKMLALISKEISKIEGSFVYDVISPISNELEQVYIGLDNAIGKMSVENLVGDELEQRIKEKSGLVRKAAKKARGLLRVNGNATIKVGTRFQSISGIDFIAIQEKVIENVGVVKIEAVEPGSRGNLPANQIVNIPVVINGITSVNNDEPTLDGYDVESDEELIQRYYERMRTPATSGNKQHYINWAKEVEGVGAAKVFPLYAGPNTVKVLVLDSNKQPASEELIANVQLYIDPYSKGLGDGQAPIGAHCKIESAIKKGITVTVTIVEKENYSLSAIKNNIELKIINYLKSIAFTTDNTVRCAKIGALIMEAEGVHHYNNLRISSPTSSNEVEDITVGEEEVAVLEEILINETLMRENKNG